MRQNFVADNIVKLGIDTFGSDRFLVGRFSGALDGVSYVSRGDSVSAITFAVDIDSDSLLSFDLLLGSQTVGAQTDVVIGVSTFVDSSAAGVKTVNMKSASSGLFFPLVVGDRLVSSGRVIVPALVVPEGSSQLVTIGFVSDSGSSIASSVLGIQARVHTEDITVFDPLRQ